jgi:rod shape-determining protein MreC
MAVITPIGIVGKIVQLADDWSQVLPINDQFSGVGAALKDSRLQGILKGTPSGATTLQYIMSDEKVTPGEDVITSGGDRIFPKGLPVGKVVSVQPGKDLFLNIRVVPAARLDQVEEVLVVTKITEKLPDTKDLGPLRASDILAERLPSVPNKPEVDAAGNVKPGSGNVAPGTAPTGSATGTGAHPAATGAATRPAAGAVTTTKPPSGATTQHPTTPGAAGAVKPKPAGTTGASTGTSAKPVGSGTSPAVTHAKPANGTQPSATPSNKVRVVDNDDAPAPKVSKPPSQSPPADQSAEPSTGAPPQ